MQAVVLDTLTRFHAKNHKFYIHISYIILFGIFTAFVFSLLQSFNISEPKIKRKLAITGICP